MRSRRSLIPRLAAVAVAVLVAVAPPAAGQDPTATTAAPAAVASTTAPATPADRETETRSADAASERDIRRIVVLLLGIAAVMTAATVVFWRATRPLAPELDGLATIGSRGFRQASPLKRKEMLGHAPFDRLARLQRGEPLPEPSAPVVPAAAAVASRPPPPENDDVAEDPDPSVVEPDPAIALERPVLDDVAIEPASADGLGAEEAPAEDVPAEEPASGEEAAPDDAELGESAPDQEASAGPVPG
jgi:hypothetical protein